MRILFIAPLPPPINGQALASEIFLDTINKYHNVIVVNTAERRSSYFPIIKRIFEVFLILLNIRKNVRDADLIYLTISESLSGNLKDLVTYLICYKKLDCMFIHLHGGAGMTNIMKEKGLSLKKINDLFLEKLKGIIILGNSQKAIFKDTISPSKLYIVPNFAEDYLFLDEDIIAHKYKDPPILNLLFMSNMIPTKGYMELLNGYKSINETRKSKICLNFAGAFFNDQLRSKFLQDIKGMQNIHYHGVVRGSEKKKLFADSHVFCLPTYFPYEGQPISILEAYATGCVVLTTDHSGIKDIFSNNINGYFVEKRSPVSIKATLEYIADHFRDLYKIGLYNNQLARERYRVDHYNQSLRNITGA